MPLQHFTILGKYLGTREVPAFMRDTTFGPRQTYSICYFCPRCASVWASLLIENAPYAQVFSEECRRHGRGQIDRYCKFEWWPSELDRSWPIEALRYVVLRELELFEQRNRYAPQ